MAAYLLKRLLLIIPTLFGIMLISFAIIQFAPGGPVDRIIAQLTGRDSSIVSRIGGGGQALEGAQAAQVGIDCLVVVGVIAVVARRLDDGVQVDRRDPEVHELIEALSEAEEISTLVAVERRRS